MVYNEARISFFCLNGQRPSFAQALNPIVVGLFDSTILVGGGAKKPPLPNS